MSRSALWRRDLQRVAHLLFAVILGVFVYSPLRTQQDAVLFVQTIVFPLLVVSGVVLWKGQKLRRWFESQ